MKTKLFCSDIDGTLLNKDRELSERTITAIKNLSKIPFILISSRMPKAMAHLQEELNTENLPVIAYNGALILDQKEVLHSTEIGVDIIREIVDSSAQTGLHISLYHKNEWYVPELDFWAKREWNNTKVEPKVQLISRTLDKWKQEDKGAHKIMVMGDEQEIDSLEEWMKELKNKTIVGYRSKPTYLEIAPRSVSKKTAIQELIQQKYPKIRFSEITAFGDNYNDMEMLESVGIGVAVANAKKEVIAIADVHTDTNKNDGVAKYLEKEEHLS
jgi:Cof subfamily protein (haloacid dehalogenase superfamily)